MTGSLIWKGLFVLTLISSVTIQTSMSLQMSIKREMDHNYTEYAYPETDFERFRGCLCGLKPDKCYKDAEVIDFYNNDHNLHPSSNTNFPDASFPRAMFQPKNIHNVLQCRIDDTTQILMKCKNVTTTKEQCAAHQNCDNIIKLTCATSTTLTLLWDPTQALHVTSYNKSQVELLTCCPPPVTHGNNSNGTLTNKDYGAAVGGVFGALAVIAIAIVVIVILRKRRKDDVLDKRGDTQTSEINRMRNKPANGSTACPPPQESHQETACYSVHTIPVRETTKKQMYYSLEITADKDGTSKSPVSPGPVEDKSDQSEFRDIPGTPSSTKATSYCYAKLHDNNRVVVNDYDVFTNTNHYETLDTVASPMSKPQVLPKPKGWKKS